MGCEAAWQVKKFVKRSALRFAHCGSGIVQRDQHPDRSEPLGCVGAEVEDPVVVGAADRNGQLGIQVFDGRGIESLRRVEERSLHLPMIHRLHLRLGTVPRLPVFAEMLLHPGGECALHRQAHAVHPLDVRGEPPTDAEPGAPLGQDHPRRAIAERRIDIALPHAAGLHDVTIGIDDPEPSSSHGTECGRTRWP